MKESKEMLRQRFQSQTDVEVGLHPGDWKRYAEWLEKLAIGELNNELVEENEALRNRMQKAMDALEEGITGAYRIRMKCKTRRRKRRRV